MPHAIDPLAALRAALHALGETLENFSFRLPGPAQDAREEERAGLLWSIREYLLTRLADLEAPVVAVVLGSTGSGKSTLVNSLAQERVSEVGAVRPTTRFPVVWAHRDHRRRYGNDFLTGYGMGLSASRGLRVVTGEDPLLEQLTIVDAPDFDSVVEENREMADELLAVADLCVFVTTAQRYADAVPWDFLALAHRRGLPILFVVNRLPLDAAGREQILTDYAERLEERGLLLEPDPGLLFAILEQPIHPSHGALPPESVAGIRRELGLLSDPALRRQLVRQATEGAVAEVVYRGRELADLVAEEDREAAALADAARLACRTQSDEVAGLLRSGTLIRQEVLSRWQEFVGTGDLLRSLQRGVGRVQQWARAVFGGQSPEAVQVGVEAEEELLAAVVRRADLAARAAAAAWERDPAGKVLLTQAPQGSLWRHDLQTPARARRALEDWMGELNQLVQQLGEGKRRAAMVASVGVNVAAVTLLLAVFAHTGGMTGAELGVTAGAAAAQQKLLEHMFGAAAAQSLAEEARTRLEAALTGVLEADAARFVQWAEGLSSLDNERRIRRQVDEVSRRGGEFYGG